MIILCYVACTVLQYTVSTKATTVSISQYLPCPTQILLLPRAHSQSNMDAHVAVLLDVIIDVLCALKFAVKNEVMFCI